MKCDKTITQATAVDNTVKVFVCNGEMVEVGAIHDELPIVNVFGEPVVEKKLYQCESCKTIKLC